MGAGRFLSSTLRSLLFARTAALSDHAKPAYCHSIAQQLLLRSTRCTERFHHHSLKEAPDTRKRILVLSDMALLGSSISSKTRPGTQSWWNQTTISSRSCRRIFGQTRLSSSTSVGWRNVSNITCFKSHAQPSWRCCALCEQYAVV